MGMSDVSCSSWEYLLPDVRELANAAKDKQTAYENKEKEKERKRIEKEEQKKEKEREKQLKKEKALKEKEEKARLAKEGGTTNNEASTLNSGIQRNDKKNRDDNDSSSSDLRPPEKRQRIDESSRDPRLSPATSLFKHLTVMSETERRAAIKNINVLPIKVAER